MGRAGQLAAGPPEVRSGFDEGRSVHADALRLRLRRDIWLHLQASASVLAADANDKRRHPRGVTAHRGEPNLRAVHGAVPRGRSRALVFAEPSLKDPSREPDGD